MSVAWARRSFERVDVREALPQQGQFQLVAAVSGLKVDDAVAAGIQVVIDEGVRALAADEEVVAPAAFQPVVTIAAAQGIVATPPMSTSPPAPPRR